jgi:hypothetical protein
MPRRFGYRGYSRLNVLIEKGSGDQSILKIRIVLVFSPTVEASGSLPCSQKPTTGPHPESDDFSSKFHIMFLKDLF